MDIEIKIRDAEQYKKIKDTIKEIIKGSEENNSLKFKEGLKNRDFKILLEGIAESSLFALFIDGDKISAVFIFLICEVDKEFALDFMEYAISEGILLIIDGCDVISIDVKERIRFKYCNINNISIDCYNRQPIDLSNEFFACKIHKLELYNIRNTSMTKEEITESIRTDFRYARTTVSEIIIN